MLKLVTPRYFMKWLSAVSAGIIGLSGASDCSKCQLGVSSLVKALGGESCEIWFVKRVSIEMTFENRVLRDELQKRIDSRDVL